MRWTPLGYLAEAKDRQCTYTSLPGAVGTIAAGLAKISLTVQRGRGRIVAVSLRAQPVILLMSTQRTRQTGENSLLPGASEKIASASALRVLVGSPGSVSVNVALARGSGSLVS